MSHWSLLLWMRVLAEMVRFLDPRPRLYRTPRQRRKSVPWCPAPRRPKRRQRGGYPHQAIVVGRCLLLSRHRRPTRARRALDSIAPAEMNGNSTMGPRASGWSFSTGQHLLASRDRHYTRCGINLSGNRYSRVCDQRAATCVTYLLAKISLVFTARL